MALIWQHGKRTDDYRINFNCVRNLMKINEKRGWEWPKLFLKMFFHPFKQSL
jgi:hypothetical protein